VLRDLRLTIRQLHGNPGYASACVITLALAIGASTAIFSAVHAILLNPLPIDKPGDLVIGWGADFGRGLPVVELSYRNVQEWPRVSQVFSRSAAMGSSNWTTVLDKGGESVRLASAGVTASFFDTLGARPLLGRTFQPDDDVPNAARVAVLGYATWQRRFGSDAGVIGTTAILDDQQYTVVGVMPKGFEFPRGAELWVPVAPVLAASSARFKSNALADAGVLHLIGRLRAGVTPGLAARELERAAGAVAASGVPRFGTSVVVTPFLEFLLGPVRPALWLLFATVGVLLLIACANVSGLMLARASRQRREYAVRLALGASAGDLGRLWALEVVLISIAGAVFGVLAARWAMTLIVALAPDDVPRLSDVSISLPVAAFTVAATALTAALCGIGPIRRARRTGSFDVLAATERATTGRSSQRIFAVLLTGQIALVVVLLVAAGLVVRSFDRLLAIDLGFAPDRVLTMNVAPRGAAPASNLWFEDLLNRVSSLPGVEAVGAILLAPLELGPIGQETPVLLEGQPDTPASKRGNPTLNYQVATPGYFRAMRITLQQGRLFEARDDAGAARVAIVSDGTARRLWPGVNPIGKRLAMPTFAPGSPQDAWRTVVGVVADVRYRGITDARLDVYDPAVQASMVADHLVVRTASDPLSIAASIQATARALDPRVVIDRVTTMDAVVSRATAPWRLGAWMLTLFAAAAAGLAAVGLFSVVNLAVTSRRQELAIRLALGAAPRTILRSVMATAAGWIAAGLVVGIALAAAGSRAIRTLLFEVDPIDGWTYTAVVVFLLMIVTLASYLPARRAATIDPMIILRR
jgi:putative ABC transport system permease protein